MRKFWICAALVCVILLQIFSVSAAPAAKSVSAYATVSPDGSCQMTLTANVYLDGGTDDLQFPLPAKASNITVNGARAHSRMEGGLRQVDVSRVVGKAAGDFTLTFTYQLPNLIVTNDADQLELHLPVLAGFGYPVQGLELSVTLPGDVTEKPAFSSGYHQANIEKDIYCTTSGPTITAVAQTELKDHETLTMTLLVTEEMFPQNRIAPPDFQTVNTLTAVFFVAALLYWALFLRNLPAWPARRPTPPEGYTAGEMGSVLHLQGADLTTMIFSWASLGYVRIHLKPGGHVTLYRRMEMGNERSAFEQRCFQMLFGRRDSLEVSPNRYAEVCLAVSRMKPSLPNLIHPRSGNLKLFRGLAALAGLFCGTAIAINMASGAGLQWFLIILLGALALISSWHIQKWAVNLLVPDRKKLWIALALCALWLLLSALAGLFGTGMGMVAGQLFAGLLAALGGRRTLAGRQGMGEVLGLRRYLRSVPRDELGRICQNNPEYFHQMFPYALALGADKAFAKRFGSLSIGKCPYVETGFDSDMRANQWDSLLRRVYTAMNVKPRNDRLEKLKDLIYSFIK